MRTVRIALARPSRALVGHALGTARNSTRRLLRYGAVAALIVACARPGFAQIQGGTVHGAAKDEQGGVLPGVTVTLQGADATRTFVTTETGEFRFLDLPPGTYKLELALEGFTTIERENLIVSVGRDVDLPVTMKIAAIATTITVTAPAPIVNRRETGTATNFTSNELTKIPTSRDPFALMRGVPGVLIDRVNVGGNETGQASNFVSKGTRPQDAVWTLDGVVVTDMASTGAPPTYFNYDNFEEIHVATAGQDIRQPTGGVGLNFVVKRGTNQFHGAARGYFQGESMSASNVPDELVARGVTPATADHNKQISDVGGELGGPLLPDRAWFYASYSTQDIRLVRQNGGIVDRTELRNPNVKINWQATRKDLVNFLFFNGSKIKDGRSPGIGGITFDAPTATYHQDNAYSGSPLHGLWKIADDRTVADNMFLTAKYAYYNTGFVLDPEGGMNLNVGRDFTTGSSYGSLSRSLNLRPQHTVNADLHSFFGSRGGTHDVKYGVGFRHIQAETDTTYPADGTLALKNSPTALFVQVLRPGIGANSADYFDLYAGDTLSLKRLTIEGGVRYDRQWGAALASTTPPNPAFPTVVPGVMFAGYDSPFVWNTVSPRAGVTYALDDSRRTIAHASYSRFPGQLGTSTIGYANPSAMAGSAVFGWDDVNNNHLAEPNEVLLNQFVTGAGGFNPANPTAVVSANRIDPNLKPPVTSSIVAGVDRELVANLLVQVNYTYTRTSDLFGNFSANITPRVGVVPGLGGDYTPGLGFSGALPDGTPYSVATWIPIPAKVAAGGNGFLAATVQDYYVDYHGIEVNLVKRLSDRWMARASFGYNNAREHFSTPAGRYDTNGNPTPTLSEPLVDGGQFAPISAGSGGGNVYMNAKWQMNLNGLYQAPYGIELAANVFGRQGYPFPIFRQGTTATLGADSGLPVLVTPTIDSIRYPNLWDTDLRIARTFKVGTVSLRGMFDIFNLMNANTALVRNNNIGSTAFNLLAQNLSPRVARIGLQLGF